MGTAAALQLVPEKLHRCYVLNLESVMVFKVSIKWQVWLIQTRFRWKCDG